MVKGKKVQSAKFQILLYESLLSESCFPTEYREAKKATFLP